MIGKLSRLLFLFLMVFVLIPHAKAIGIEDEVLKNPAGVDELTVNIIQHGLVEIEGSPTKIRINLTIPQDDERQDVESGVKKVKNEFGSEVGIIEETNPDNPFAYSFSSVVRSRANHLTSLPGSYTIPDDVEIYLQATENIQSSDQRFRSLAEEITKDSKDDFEKVAKLALWVYDHMTYDLSYAERNIDAVTILNEKRGVCSEYTTLFVALARSIGIPTKYVSGWAFGETYGIGKWERHAYAEVYLGKWVPVDPLWLEIGYMDATHLKFGDHADNRVRNNVEVAGYNVKGIKWAKDDTNLSTVSYSPVEREEEYGLTVSSEEFRKGDEGIVTLSIVPKEFIVGKMVLKPCAGEYEIVEVEESEKRVLLRPGEKEQVWWKIKLNPDLPKNYIFTCPLTLNSRSLALRAINANVNTQYGGRGERKLSARLSSEVLGLGGGQTVYVDAENLGRDAWVGIIAENEHKKYLVDSGDFSTSFTFIPSKLGKNSVVIYTSEGEVVTLEYEVKSSLSVDIEDFSVPQYLKVGEGKNISANIVNRGRAEENVRSNLKVEGEDNLANFILKDAHAVSLPVSFQTPGPKTIRLEISLAGLNLSETRVIEVYEEPAVHFDTSYDEGKAVLKLDVKKSKIKNVTVRIGGNEKKADEVFGEKALDFPLAPGEYAMEIACSDIAGKPYKISETVEFREKNILEKILDMINTFIQNIMGFFSH